jgi:hypothetical protein
MAIWQYAAYLVPLDSVGPDGTLPSMVIDEETFDLPKLAFTFSSIEFEHYAANYLPPAKSWSDHVRLWGDDARDDLHLFTGGGTMEIRARLNLRDLTIERVRNLLRFAQALRCCFLEARKREVVTATVDALIESIRTSRSSAFVVDPHGFLRHLFRDEAGQPPE